MRLFVTGGTGFIGSHFVNHALAAGHEVVALRRTRTSIPRIPLAVEPIWVDKSLTTVEADDLVGCEALVHLAAHSANVPYDSLETCITQNVLEPIQLIRTAATTGICNFLMAGSCFEYGRAGERYENIPVDAPLEPTTSYPASKAAAHVAFYALACELELKMLMMRIFQVFGEGESENRFWPTLRRTALEGKDMPMTDGLQVRDFVHVEEVAKQFVASLESLSNLAPGRPTVKNVGSGKAQTLADFARQEWKRFGAKGELKFGAKPRRAGEVMRYAPKIDYEL